MTDSYGSSGIYYFPDYVDYPLSIWPPSESSISTIEIMDVLQFDKQRPGITYQTGKPRVVLHGWYGVERDNPTVGPVTVNGDTGVKVLVEGFDASGYQLREKLTLAGGTAVTTGSFRTGPGGVRRVAITSTTGVTLTTMIEALSGGTRIAYLNPNWERVRMQRRARFYGGDAGAQFEMSYYRRHFPLQDDDDLIEVPQEFHDVVELGVARKLAIFSENPEQATLLETMFKDRLRELVAWDKRQPGRKFRIRINERFKGTIR
jgi:hypothetical protein